jgi:hypothetical protein
LETEQGQARELLVAIRCTNDELDNAEYLERLEAEMPDRLKGIGHSMLETSYGGQIPDGKYQVVIRGGVYEPAGPAASC